MLLQYMFKGYIAPMMITAAMEVGKQLTYEFCPVPLLGVAKPFL
jgi:hypothetical protein